MLNNKTSLLDKKTSLLDSFSGSRETVYLSAGSTALFDEQKHRLSVTADRTFAFLFGFQWLLGLVFAFMFGGVTFHWYMAIFLGGALAFYPAYQNLKHPGDSRNRFVSAVAQMGFSALFVHLTGGRIESHFHIFGSLAFLAFYRDIRVLLLASAVTALDHFVIGALSPLSIYGTLSSTPWRALEHTLWVGFEDIFLFISIGTSLQEMKLIAKNQFELQNAFASVEKLAADRTADLMLSKETILEQQRTLTTSEGQAETVGLALIHTIIERAIGFRESKIRACNVKVSIDLPAHRLFVNGRASELIQACVHLIDHAIDSSSGQPVRTLSIAARRLGESIELSIEGNGMVKPGEAGLDFTIAQNAMKSHAGKLSLETGLAAGVRFVATLPNALESAAQTRSA